MVCEKNSWGGVAEPYITSKDSAEGEKGGMMLGGAPVTNFFKTRRVGGGGGRGGAAREINSLKCF